MPVSVSRSVVPDYLQPHGLQLTRLLCPWDFPGNDTGVGCHFLLQGIFPTQGLNPGLLHCRQIIYWLNYKGSPYLPVEGKNMVYHYCFSFLFFGHFHQPSLPGLAVMRLDPGVLTQLCSENGAGVKMDDFWLSKFLHARVNQLILALTLNRSLGKGNFWSRTLVQLQPWPVVERKKASLPKNSVSVLGS